MQAPAVKTSAPAQAAVQTPPSDGQGAAAQSEELREKLTRELKAKNARRAADAAKKAGKPAGKAETKPAKPRDDKGKGEQPKAKAATEEPPAKGSRPKRGPAPENDDEEEPEAKPKGKGKPEPKDKHADKREAARKALAGETDDEDDGDGDGDLETAAGRDDEEGKELDERKTLQREKRDFAKFRRKKEGEYEKRDRDLQGRESQVQQLEQQLTSEVGVFKKDPLAWLKARGIDVRETLVAFANEDGEDPKDKKLREIDERTKKLDEKLSTEEQARQQAEATERIRVAFQEEFEDTDGADYPNLWTHSDPERVSRAATKIALDHYRAHGKKLEPSEVFAILEQELIAHNARLAREAKRKQTPRATEDKSSEPPEQVRSVARREPESPEVRRSSRRPSEDVTNRETRLSRDDYRGAAGSFDRDSVREKLVDMARERIR